MKRGPAAAGRFYPDTAPDLLKQVHRYLKYANIMDPYVPQAIIVPHAGYLYAGQTAAHSIRT
ncbi:MAG: AmmeMemoRadiSam system protein B [Bacteroidales bacterium]|nr:AmmeMemoRadiSam system protein B [Bacteroidales bacterium]